VNFGIPFGASENLTCEAELMFLLHAGIISVRR
jgi:hypothetical protein